VWNAPLIINGTITLSLQFDQAFALNAANVTSSGRPCYRFTPNSTAGKGVGAVSLQTPTTERTFHNETVWQTPAWWISADDLKVYAINALNGKILLNFPYSTGSTRSPETPCRFVPWHRDHRRPVTKEGASPSHPESALYSTPEVFFG